jgi:hypothetical protein
VAFGLPYERDVAITRHVASFFARHAPGARGESAGGDGEKGSPAPLAPSAILLNGGVFRAPRLVSRLAEAIGAWRSPPDARPLRVLAHADPDLAVARGAVVYALARHGRGLRIGGGSPRGYYVEVAGEGERTGVCIVPRGAREGVPQVARSRPLSLTIGRPARFELWASDEATGHAPGEVVLLDDERFTRLPPVAAAFPRGPAGSAHAKEKEETILVALEGELTEIGTLDLACVELEPRSDASPRRFRLAFALRRAAPPSTAPPPSLSVPPASRGSGAIDAACEAVARVYGKGRADVTAREVKDLVRDLERHLGERGSWSTATTRALFDVLAPGRSGRRRSPDHERVFWQLAGYCLRPGFGDPLDGERVALLAPLVPERLSFPDQTRGWQQFFIAWRRVAAGMTDPQQISLRDLADPWLAPSEARAKMKKQKGARPLADPEMLEMVASLERVPSARRAELGGWILERTWTDRDPRLWEAIRRLGARVPAYASVDHVVLPAVVERWVEQILREKWDQVPAAAEAAIALSRVTGDRARDLSESVRKEVARRLAAAGADAGRVRPVLELVAVEEEERVAFWGESLPVGLRLAG